MYAIAFDLVVADTEEHHPRGVTQAYFRYRRDSQPARLSLGPGKPVCDGKRRHGEPVSGHSSASFPDWFPKSVRDIRAFRIEQWSDFTTVVKGP